MIGRVMASLALLGTTAVAAPPRSADHGDAELVRTVVGLAQEFARNATNMHPERNARMIPDTQKVVYVSNGYPIRGHDYVATLSKAYATRKSQLLRWDKWEVTPIGKDAAVFTGWATMSEETREGHRKTGKYIFTTVFAKTSAGWKRVIAQKAPLEE